MLTVIMNGKKKGLESSRLARLNSVPGKVKEQIILETILKYIKDKKVTGRVLQLKKVCVLQL